MMLYIVRHGETRLNELGCLQGWVDETLNENGRSLAKITGEAFKTVYFDKIITSPLARAKETATLMVQASEEHLGYQVPVYTDDRLKEINWGSWDTLGCLESNFEIPSKHYDTFFVDPFHFEGSPDGESIPEVCERTGEFLHELINNPEEADKTILVSTHGCAMRALLRELYEDPNDFWQGHVPYNCAINIVKVENGKARLLKKDGIYYDPALCFDHYKVVEKK